MFSAKNTFLFIFSQAHPDFRRAEFEAVCRLCAVSPVPTFSTDASHIQLLEFPDGEASVGRVLGRSMLIKQAFLLIAKGESHEEVLLRLETNRESVADLDSPDQSWCLSIRPQRRKRRCDYIQSIVDRYAAAVRFERAPIDLSNPKNVLTVIEIYDETNESQSRSEAPSKVYFARLLGEGQGHLKAIYSLHQRRYIGNSTMDPELAFIQANLSQARHGSVLLDPFCGTGLILPAAHFGSHVIGVEIKWDVARAKGKSSRAGELWLGSDQSIRANFDQYNMADDRFLGIVLADSSRSGLWYPRVINGSVDAIITDPPYGVRERGIRLGKSGNRNGKDRQANEIRDDKTPEKFCSSDNGNAEQRRVGNEDKINQSGAGFPEKQKYSMSNVFLDLMDLAARLLCLGGRLSFWFPVCRFEYNECHLPRTNCMRLVHNCEQPLTKNTARRLLVYEKFRDPLLNGDGTILLEKAHFDLDNYANESFRQKIFNSNTERERMRMNIIENDDQE